MPGEGCTLLACAPIITKEVFAKVKSAVGRRGIPPAQKAQVRIHRPPHLQMRQTPGGQLQKGQYVYYACSAYCGTSTVSEKKRSAMFLDAIKRIQITPDVAEYIRQGLKSFEGERRTEHERRVRHLQQRQCKVQRRVDEAYDDNLAGRITQDYWDRRSSAWQGELAEIGAEIRRLETATFQSIENADAILEPAQRAPELFVAQDPAEKARLVRIVALNSVYEGTTLAVTYREPFDLLIEGLSYLCGADEIRTRDLWLDRPAF